jgi:hypothetical protein
MGNVLHKRCRENQNTHFMLNNFFSENFTVCETMSKNVVETEGPQMTSQYGAYALHAEKARLHPRTSMHTPTRSGTHTHARTPSPASTNYCLSTATMIRKRASILRNTYIAS